MNRLRLVVLFLCVSTAACWIGCGRSEKQRYAVSGEVKLRGKLLDRGAITFLREDQGDSGGALIKDGRYDIPARGGLLPGRYKVMITSADPAKTPDPDAPPGPAGPLPKDRIKSKYNTQTVLTSEVKPEGPNTFNFDVD